MRKKNHYFLYLLSLLFLAACSNEDLDSGKPDSLHTERDGSIEFIYMGKLYSSTYSLTPDSLIVLNDNIANEVYRDLGLRPNLAVVVNENGILTYYDSYNEIPFSNSIDSTSTHSSLRSSDGLPRPTSFSVDMFEDSSYNGKKISFTIDENKAIIYIPSLGAHGMNDKISSLKYRVTKINSTLSPDRYPWALIPSFTLFEHNDYQGRSITFTSTKMLANNTVSLEDAVRRLKEVPMGGDNWNDKASSAIIGK